MSEAYAGQQWPGNVASEHSTHAFMQQQMLGRISTVKLVKIVAITGGGGAADVAGTVDVMPLTKQMNGIGESQSHDKVYGLIYHRAQAGPFAIIADPAVGDVGYAVICDRDISANKASPGQEAQPGSYRRFNLADGVYIGGTLNQKPTSYIRVQPDGSVTINTIDGDNLSPAGKWDNTDKKLYLGGDPATVPKTKFSPVVTSAGPSINVLARWQV